MPSGGTLGGLLPAADEEQRAENIRGGTVAGGLIGGGLGATLGGKAPSPHRLGVATQMSDIPEAARPLQELLEEGDARAAKVSPRNPVAAGRRYYHVAPEDYRPGDPIYSMAALRKVTGRTAPDKWVDEMPGYRKSPHARNVSLADTYAEAVDFLVAYLDGKGYILAVDVPPGAKITRNSEGYAQIPRMVPAEWVTPVALPKELADKKAPPT